MAITRLENEAIKHEEMQKILVAAQLKNGFLSEVDGSTLMNVHRELLSCKKSLLSTIRDIDVDCTDNA